MSYNQPFSGNDTLEKHDENQVLHGSSRLEGFRMKRRWRIKFGVGTLLFAAFVVSGFFFGLYRGEETNRSNRVSTLDYKVAPLINKSGSVRPQLDSIICLVCGMVDPDSWLSNGGSASILPYPQALSISVSQSGENHAKIADLIDSLTDFADDEVVSAKYDCSRIVNRSSSKSVEEQIETIVAILERRYPRAPKSPHEFEIMPIEFTLDLMHEAVIVKTRSKNQKTFHDFFKTLRFARETISDIDSP